MATFLGVEQLIDMYFRELPQGEFPKDRANNANPNLNSFSSADIRAQMQALSLVYSNMANIYGNKFASDVDLQGMARWERDYFATPVDTSQPLETRRANVLAKKRANGGISITAIRNVLTPIFAAAGLPFDIVTWGCQNGGAWILDESILDVSTYLSLIDPLIGAVQPNPLDCSLNYAAAGLTAQQLADIQTVAYTYEVRITGVASAAFLAMLDALLTQIEPARSTHYIYNNFPGPFPP